MTVQYESIYPSFAALSYSEKLSLIQDVRSRRRAFITPKKTKKAAAKKQATKRSSKNKASTLLDQMSEEEKAELLKELDGD